jgi:hypothetical protein
VTSPPFLLAAVGDVMLAHPITVAMTDRASAGVLDLLRHADLAVGNCELSAFDPADPRPVPQIDAGGLWLNAEPDGIADLQALGFGLMSRANNHALDFGIDGLAATNRLLERHGIAHAGSGDHLTAALAPAYVTTRAGRVALISATDSGPPYARAGYARTDMRGRPGVNILRLTRRVILNPPTFDALANAITVARQHQCPLGRIDREQQRIDCLDTRFDRGEQIEPVFTFNESDVEDTLAQVRLARLRADRVLFALHTHLNDACEQPPRAIRELAHRCIEAGADVVIGHGPHAMRGIEIHHGRPIFHSLGNFVWHLFKGGAQPADWYDRRGLDPIRASMEDFFGQESPMWEKRQDANFWRTVIASVHFDDARIQVELRPVDLCPQAAGWQVGSPRLADKSTGRAILDRIRQLSEPMGTDIVERDGVGLVDCAMHQASAVGIAG